MDNVYIWKRENPIVAINLQKIKEVDLLPPTLYDLISSIEKEEYNVQ